MNIFTDASITKSIYGETIGCAGVIFDGEFYEERYYILRDATNNISELSAILFAVQSMVELGIDTANIYSDSQWSIYGLTKWNRSWMSNMVNYSMYNSSGNRVKNQEIFLSIMKYIIDNNLKITFYHVKGHVNVADQKSLNNATDVFRRSNNTPTNIDNIIYIANMNNRVDMESRVRLKDYSKVERMYLERGMILPIIENINIYYNLVRLGRNKI